MWQRMRTGSATKGARDYHWAMIEITPDDTPDGHDDRHAFLLLRRHRYTGTVSYFLCWSPAPVPLAKLISVAVARWRIEEDHQQSKQVSGLDSGQVTTWTSWHRWTAVSLLAYAFSAVAAACQRALDGGGWESLGLIPVSLSPSCSGSSAGPSSPTPVATRPTETPGRYGADATSTRPSKPTSAGTPTPVFGTAAGRLIGWRVSEFGYRLDQAAKPSPDYLEPLFAAQGLASPPHQLAYRSPARVLRPTEHARGAAPYAAAKRCRVPADRAAAERRPRQQIVRSVGGNGR